jgi:hypothetical protein
MNDACFKLNRLWLRVLSGSVLLVPLASVACGGSDQATGAAKAPQAEAHHAEVLAHEPCNESGNRVDALDTNGDGKPDIKRVFDKGTGQELCRIVDLSRDGKADLYEYFETGGTVRRREYCYDDTGVINAVEYYEKGRLVRREYDAAGRHKIDTWDTFDPTAAVDPRTGRPAHPTHRERDTSGDGKVDQWWTWNGDKVTITADLTGDGKPDPATTIVLGADNAPIADNAPAPAPAAPAASAAANQVDGGKP